MDLSYIYIVKRRRPCFVGGAIKIPSIDWLVGWGLTALSAQIGHIVP